MEINRNKSIYGLLVFLRSDGSSLGCFPINKTHTIIGSGEDSDIKIMNLSIFSMHAQILVNCSSPCIQPLNSEAVVFVNDRRINGFVQLYDNDVISICEERCIYRNIHNIDEASKMKTPRKPVKPLSPFKLASPVCKKVVTDNGVNFVPLSSPISKKSQSFISEQAEYTFANPSQDIQDLPEYSVVPIFPIPSTPARVTSKVDMFTTPSPNEKQRSLSKSNYISQLSSCMSGERNSSKSKYTINENSPVSPIISMSSASSKARDMTSLSDIRSKETNHIYSPFHSKVNFDGTQPSEDDDYFYDDTIYPVSLFDCKGPSSMEKENMFVANNGNITNISHSQNTNISFDEKKNYKSIIDETNVLYEIDSSFFSPNYNKRIRKAEDDPNNYDDNTINLLYPEQETMNSRIIDDISNIKKKHLKIDTSIAMNQIPQLSIDLDSIIEEYNEITQSEPNKTDFRNTLNNINNSILSDSYDELDVSFNLPKQLTQTDESNMIEQNSTIIGGILTTGNIKKKLPVKIDTYNIDALNTSNIQNSTKKKKKSNYVKYLHDVFYDDDNPNNKSTSKDNLNISKLLNTMTSDPELFSPQLSVKRPLRVRENQLPLFSPPPKKMSKELHRLYTLNQNEKELSQINNDIENTRLIP